MADSTELPGQDARGPAQPDEPIAAAGAEEILNADAQSPTGRPVDRPTASSRARQMAGGKLEDTARRMRDLGDRAAAKNRLLGPTRPLARNAADGIDNAARYVRQRELDEMRTDLETQVREHPLASVALAFMAGYALRRIF